MKALRTPLNENGYAPLLKGKDISDMGPIYAGIYSGLAICANIFLELKKEP